jgi:hypothetical protein
VQSHSFDVKFNRLAHQFPKFFDCVGSANATWEIWDISSEVAADIFDDDCVFGHCLFLLSPACL